MKKIQPYIYSAYTRHRCHGRHHHRASGHTALPCGRRVFWQRDHQCQWQLRLPARHLQECLAGRSAGQYRYPGRLGRDHRQRGSAGIGRGLCPHQIFREHRHWCGQRHQLYRYGRARAGYLHHRPFRLQHPEHRAEHQLPHHHQVGYVQGQGSRASQSQFQRLRRRSLPGQADRHTVQRRQVFRLGDIQGRLVHTRLTCIRMASC
jgi:hypothetical protein